MQKYYSTFIVLVFLTVTQFNQQEIYASKKIKRVTTEITDKHIVLYSTSNFIYIVPPEGFRADTAQEKVLFGLMSEKYDAGMRFSFRIDYSDDINVLRNGYNILKNESMKINDFNLKYFKLKPLNDGSKIEWLVFADNPFFSFYGILSYDIKFDKTLSKNVEKAIRSIIVTRNTFVTPENNISITGDFSLLDLKFVQRVSVPLAYWTEDGLPANATKGSKVVILGTPPSQYISKMDIADNAIRSLNNVLRNSVLNDTNHSDNLIAKRVQPTEFVALPGVIIEGVLESDANKHFIAVYSVPDSKVSQFYAILAICDEDEKEELFERIMKFKETVSL